MLVNEIPKEKIKYCIEGLQEIFSPASEGDYRIVKRALSLFRNGAVFNASAKGDTIKAAVLDDGEDYEVELELDFMEISYCSCQQEEFFCVHKLAALFYVFSLFDSPGEFFNNWKAGHQYKATEKMPSTPKRTIFDASKKKERMYQEDSLESWLAYFNEKYVQFTKKREAVKATYWNYPRNSNIAEDLYETYYPALMDTPMPSSPYGEILFHLHAAVTVFEKILESARDSYATTYSNHYTGKYLKEITSDIVELAFNARECHFKQTDADEMILQATPARMMDIFLLTRDFQYERFYLFQVVCTNLIRKKESLDELAQKFVDRSKDEEKLKQQGKVNFSSECRLALAHFDFMVEKDQEAMQRLSDGPANEVFYYTTWFKSLAQNKLWQRFEAWQPFIVERMHDFFHQYGDQQLKQQLTSFYLYFIKLYMNEINDESIFINTLHRWLPYSYVDFSEHLLENNEYKKWTELQLFIGIPIEKMDRDLLKEIESEDRVCLLPLYHNAVEEQISVKSRDAYRQAVKYLRKLRTHYKALKKENVWDHYIHMLSTKYKRLRAFQEELRKGKGKLIND
ncbi:SWIM zinc finger family protein [Schinkia sp. CFF1]